MSISLSSETQCHPQVRLQTEEYRHFPANNYLRDVAEIRKYDSATG